MEAIRNIQTVKNGQVHLQLPKQFWEQEVEVIVLAMQQSATPPLNKKSLRGALKQYANPALMDKEASAWLDSAGEHDEHD
jgi:thiamine pyrophosphate-dependent acetolactate synthase large subunit-like protein